MPPNSRSSAQVRIPRAADSPAKGDNGVLSPDIHRQITKSVYAATQKICTRKSQICIKGQKGEPGDPKSTSSLQLIKGEAGGVVTAPGILLQPAVSTIDLGETAAFQCSSEKNVVATISWSRKAPFPLEDIPLLKECSTSGMLQWVTMGCTCIQFVLTKGPLRLLLHSTSMVKFYLH